MKLKCSDGKVRIFEIAHCDGDRLPNGERHESFEGFSDAFCSECGHNFGCRDTKILKPYFIAHVCLECDEEESEID